MTLFDHAVLWFPAFVLLTIAVALVGGRLYWWLYWTVKVRWDVYQLRRFARTLQRLKRDEEGRA